MKGGPFFFFSIAEKKQKSRSTQGDFILRKLQINHFFTKETLSGTV